MVNGEGGGQYAAGGGHGEEDRSALIQKAKTWAVFHFSFVWLWDFRLCEVQRCSWAKWRNLCMLESTPACPSTQLRFSYHKQCHCSCDGSVLLEAGNQDNKRSTQVR